MQFQMVPDGAETLILGYPTELVLRDSPDETLKNLLESTVDFSSPLMRRGVISQKNQIKNLLIIDSGVYGGNSGGPVLVVSYTPTGPMYLIAGIVTQFVPVKTRVEAEIGVTNSVMVYSGYTVAEPIDYALELMRQF